MAINNWKYIVLLLSLIFYSCSKNYLRLSDFEWIYNLESEKGITAFIQNDSLIYGKLGNDVHGINLFNGTILDIDTNNFDRLYEKRNYSKIKILDNINNSQFHKTGVLSKEFCFSLPDDYILDKIIIKLNEKGLLAHSSWYKESLIVKERGKRRVRKFYLKEYEEINSLTNIYFVGNKYAIFYFDQVTSTNLLGDQSIGLLDFEKLLNSRRKR